jgi:inner membrane protein
LQISGNVTTELRHRGIYDVVLYHTVLNVSGRFPAPRIDEQEVSAENVLWNRAFLTVGLADPRGIDARITLDWNGIHSDFQAGTGTTTLVNSGVHGPVAVDPKGGPCTFSFQVSLRGHDALRFMPVGAQTRVHLTSPWPHPSFNGAFVPARHSEDAQGFVADWNVLDLNRSFPQSWLGAGTTFDRSDFGVRLIQPVDDYQKSDRAHKYAILFIAVTFVTLFFIEMLKNERVHILNYILMGLAICLFYVILLSVSEHLGFDKAYLLAAVTITGMISWHVRNILSQRTLCRAVGGALATVYTYMYVLLQMKDFALLFGCLGLVLLLGITMAASSRITGAPVR